MYGQPSYYTFPPQPPSYDPYPGQGRGQAQPWPLMYYPPQSPVLVQPPPQPLTTAWYPPQPHVESSHITDRFFAHTTSRALPPLRNPAPPRNCGSPMFVKKLTNYIRPQASIQEVKDWISRIDVNNDGIITQEELEDALRDFRMYLVDWRARRAMKRTDLNRNGIIDTDAEINELIAYASRHWGAAIHAYK
ncbi:hypothetical protein ACLOJK_013702 [Asimina triloba]